jgi:glycosyltransferase involved in cell wall biosynthesis
MVAGGSERVILNMVKGIESNRFAFHVITTEPASHPWRQKFQGPFENVIIPLRRTGDEAICYTYFCELIRQLRIRILVISNSIVGYRCVAKLKKSFPAVKVIDILHSEEGWGTRPELREVVPFLDRRICISYFLENFVKSRYQEAGIPDSLSSRLVTVYNGIDLTEYRRDGISKADWGPVQIPLETGIISFIGRLIGENPSFF